jgi:hypothetical protein
MKSEATAGAKNGGVRLRPDEHNMRWLDSLPSGQGRIKPRWNPVQILVAVFTKQ